MVESIVWYYNYDLYNIIEFAKWISSDAEPEYKGQWNGRTTLNTVTGQIEIRELELRDEGPGPISVGIRSIQYTLRP